MLTKVHTHMNELQILYQGSAQVYLQGQNALDPIPNTYKPNEMLYYVGEKSTDFTVKDLRKEPVNAAQEAIQLNHQNGFVKVFNKQSWVEIRYEPNNQKIEIELRDQTEASITNLPLLWFGILNDNIMPGYEVDWEVFKPLPVGTAFVSFVRKT